MVSLGVVDFAPAPRRLSLAAGVPFRFSRLTRRRRPPCPAPRECGPPCCLSPCRWPRCTRPGRWRGSRTTAARGTRPPCGSPRFLSTYEPMFSVIFLLSSLAPPRRYGFAFLPILWVSSISRRMRASLTLTSCLRSESFFVELVFLLLHNPFRIGQFPRPGAVVIQGIGPEEAPELVRQQDDAGPGSPAR